MLLIAQYSATNFDFRTAIVIITVSAMLELDRYHRPAGRFRQEPHRKMDGCSPVLVPAFLGQLCSNFDGAAGSIVMVVQVVTFAIEADDSVAECRGGLDNIHFNTSTMSADHNSRSGCFDEGCASREFGACEDSSLDDRL